MLGKTPALLFLYCANDTFNWHTSDDTANSICDEDHYFPSETQLHTKVFCLT